MTAPAESGPGDPPDFQACLECLIAPAGIRLEEQLARIDRLCHSEAQTVLAGWRAGLSQSLHQKLARLLLVELNSARVEGRLRGESAAARWDHFLDGAARPDFWPGLSRHYPTLEGRIARVVDNHVGAARDFALRWAADHDRLLPLFGAKPGPLTGLRFGAGDTHRGGRTVAVAMSGTLRVLYKPRSVGVDAAIAELIAWLEGEVGRVLPIRVPRVVAGDDYGWAEFVPHLYAADATELAGFYAGIGHWLALMRLLGGSDLHAENVIAHRGQPVIVDCETMFTPRRDPFPTGFGDATDVAMKLVRGTVLATGLLPNRGQGLGWRGVDTSGIGALPGEQPQLRVPAIVGGGTDEARLGTRHVEAIAAQNHPAPTPDLHAHWSDLISGFDEMSSLLRRLDARGDLRPALDRFDSVRVRAVLRSTDVYTQILRMLWHPVSLHEEAQARAMAQDILLRMATNVSQAPSDETSIAAEIDDLLAGDIPYFSAVAGDGVFEGPAGVTWGTPVNLVDAVVDHWRGADERLERNYVQAALASAYVRDDAITGDGASRSPGAVRRDRLDLRRRMQAAAIMSRYLETAVHGGDGTVTWIAPMLTPVGRSVQPLGPNLYSGIAGIAVLTAGYCREMRAGRADPVPGVESLDAALLRSLDLIEEEQLRLLHRDTEVRPPPPGAYTGLGGQIWARLALDTLGLDGQLDRAGLLAQALPRTLTKDDVPDILSGPAGAIRPLLQLGVLRGDRSYITIAAELGDAVCDAAEWGDGIAWWSYRDWPQGLGGFAHGVSGIGWALTHLSRATGNPRHRRVAAAALAFEDAQFDPDEQNWLDRRELGLKSATAWCHGAVGIGLARLDLDPDLTDPATRLALRRATEATWRAGLGWNQCACHGTVGTWELIDRAIALGEGPRGLSRNELRAAVVTCIEDNGPVCSVVRDVFVPGLLAGVGGIAYQLLRFHPENCLPSFLLLGDEAARDQSRTETAVPAETPA